MIHNLDEKTGKTLEEYINIVLSSYIKKHHAIIRFLKTGHGFTHGYANLVAYKTKKSDAGSQDFKDLIDWLRDSYNVAG